MQQPSPSDNLTIIIEPSSGIMRVVWARPLLTGGLIDSYYELLETAVQANCRFWHFDLRLRIWPAATFRHWFTDTFLPLATQRLRGPIYLAYWMASRHQPQIANPFTVSLQHQAAKMGFHMAFFNNEPAARAWLLHQQQAEKTLRKDYH